MMLAAGGEVDAVARAYVVRQWSRTNRFFDAASISLSSNRQIARESHA